MMRDDVQGADWRWVALFGLAYVLAWGGGLSLFHRAPALDSGEQLVWSYALEGGYWKHPPLPSWIMHALVQVFGPSVAVTLFAGAASAAIALVLGWRLGCAFMSPQRSFAAMVLTSLVLYHSAGVEAYNHNTALLPFQAAAALAFHAALRRGAWWRWALFGACAALAVLVKYVALIPLAALGIYFLVDRQVHQRRNFAGLLVAGAVFLLLLAPHAWWMHANGAPPLRYARDVSVHLPLLASLRNLAGFVLQQAVQLAPLLLVLAWLALRRSPSTSAQAVPASVPQERLFLWIAGAAPLVLILAYGLVTGTQLQDRWGSNAFLLVGWLALDALPRRIPDSVRAWRAAAVGQAALCLLLVAAVPALTSVMRWQGRAQFPGGTLARLAENTWRSRTGTPLRLVISDIWLAGNLAAHHGAPLAVLVDGELSRAPWVTQEDLAACGALVLRDRADDAHLHRTGVPDYLARAAVRGEFTLPWSASHGLRSGSGSTRIAWGILPGRGGCRL